jgi:hypothetical protein
LSFLHSMDQRWRLVVPNDAVVVMARGESAKRTAAQIAALAPNTRVAVVGTRKAIRLARRNHVTIEKAFVVLPSLDVPVAIVQLARESLDWLAHSFLTVPPGQARLHGPISFALRVIRWRPNLLTHARIGDRIVIGVRR